MNRNVSELIGLGDHKTDAQKSQREIGNLAVWSVSSAKPGNGIEMLRDGRLETFWQSDGTAPHVINIQFPKRMTLKELQLYLDFHLDESYTPEKISVRAGTSLQDLKEFTTLEMDKPVGWTSVPLVLEGNELLRAFMVQVAIISNHQSGRDTHVRQVKIYGPALDDDVAPIQSREAPRGEIRPQTGAMLNYSVVR